MSLHQSILDQLPYSHPFLFVDELTAVTENGITGSYYFDPELDFYRGHFTDEPITPGVILTETMAQIGLVCLGIFLLRDEELSTVLVAFSSADVKFLTPVFPGETVTVTSKKIYFRFNKLTCEVELRKADGELACKGILSGMFKTDDNA